MLATVKERIKKAPSGFYVMIIGIIGILTVIGLRQNYEKKRQESFVSLFHEYEKEANPELLEELVEKTHHSSFLKKQFGARLLQEVVLFRPDIFTKEWIKEPIKIKDNYDQFSQGSLLIAENRLDEALIETESLQKELSQETSPALYAFNAFRLAVLHDKLGHRAQAQACFESIMNQTKVKETLKKAYKAEACDVSDYIAQRLSSFNEVK